MCARSVQASISSQHTNMLQYCTALLHYCCDMASSFPLSSPSFPPSFPPSIPLGNSMTMTVRQNKNCHPPTPTATKIFRKGDNGDISSDIFYLIECIRQPKKCLFVCLFFVLANKQKTNKHFLERSFSLCVFA